MKELTSSRWIIAKGFLFLFLGVTSGVMLIVEHPFLRDVLLLVLAVWCFCRFYYFAFYVIERYVDPSYRFSGLGSFVVWMLRRQR